MNKIGAMTNHPPSMLYDARHQLFTEVDFFSERSPARHGARESSAPLHKAVYQLIKGKEASWTYKEENRDAVVENGMATDIAKLSRVRALMKEQDLDALVVRAPDNVVYLSNIGA